MDRRQRIAEQRDIARQQNIKADLAGLGLVMLCALGADLFATCLMLHTLATVHVYMGFAAGLVLVIAAEMVIAVGTFLGATLAK